MSPDFSYYDSYYSSAFDQVFLDEIDKATERLILEFSSEPNYFQCECGSEKVGSSMHSDWCPKYAHL